MAEGAFVINIIGAFLNIGTVNPANLPQNGFDFLASCPVNSGTQTDERACCGVLPFRYPYKSVNPANLPQNGFDFRASCPVNSGTQTDERACCGVLPFRYPYKPVDRECCGASTYDPSMMDCCSDNVPKF